MTHVVPHAHLLQPASSKHVNPVSCTIHTPPLLLCHQRPCALSLSLMLTCCTSCTQGALKQLSACETGQLRHPHSNTFLLLKRHPPVPFFPPLLTCCNQHASSM